MACFKTFSTSPFLFFVEMSCLFARAKGALQLTGIVAKRCGGLLLRRWWDGEGGEGCDEKMVVGPDGWWCEGLIKILGGLDIEVYLRVLTCDKARKENCCQFVFFLDAQWGISQNGAPYGLGCMPLTSIHCSQLRKFRGNQSEYITYSNYM